MSAPEVRVTYSPMQRFALVQVGSRMISLHLEGDILEIRYAARADDKQYALAILPIVRETVSWIDPEIRVALAPLIDDIALGLGCSAHHALQLRLWLE